MSYQAKNIAVSEIFDCMSGNSGLTSEYIYNSLQTTGKRYKVLSGATIDENCLGSVPMGELNGKTLKVIDDKEGLLVVRKGKAGIVKYIPCGDYTINDDAYILSVKAECPYDINLKWVSVAYKNVFLSYSSSSDNGTWNKTGFFDNEKMDIPEYSIQCSIADLHDRINYDLSRIEFIEKKLNKLFEQSIVSSIEPADMQAVGMPISAVLDCMNGNTGLTEEFIYSQIQDSGSRYKIFSSATTEDTLMGEIPMCVLPNGKPLKIFEDKTGLLVARNGKAGSTLFLKPGKYTINDHAYILSVKENCKYDIDLRWLAYQYRKEFLAYTSSADNGTWNKTGFFEHVTIDIPKLSIQQNLVELYIRVQTKLDRIKAIKKRLQTLNSKSIEY